MFLHFKSFILLVTLVLGSVFGIMAQAIAPQSTPAKDEKKDNKQTKVEPGKALTAEQVAERLGTINFEVVSEILARVPRVD